MAGIIKVGTPAAAPVADAHDPRSIVFNFEDMSHKAQGYLEQVRQQARQIVEQAQLEGEAIKAAAHEQGLAAARQEVEQQLRGRMEQQLDTLLPALENAVNGIRQEREAWQRNWEQQTIELAAAIARRVIQRELASQPEISLDLLREALQLALGGGRMQVRMNPADHSALRDRAENVAAKIAGLAPTDVVPDAEVPAGGCRVVTEFGVIDQTVEAQLQRIVEELV